MTGGSGTTQSGEIQGSSIASLQTSRQTKSDNVATVRQTRSKSKLKTVSVTDLDCSPGKEEQDKEMIDQQEDDQKLQDKNELRSNG